MLIEEASSSCCGGHRLLVKRALAGVRSMLFWFCFFFKLFFFFEFFCFCFLSIDSRDNASARTATANGEPRNQRAMMFAEGCRVGFDLMMLVHLYTVIHDKDLNKNPPNYSAIVAGIRLRIITTENYDGTVTYPD